MPSVIYKKSVEGFGISFIEAASYGTGLLVEKMVVLQMLFKMEFQVIYAMVDDLNSIYESIIKFYDNDNYKLLGKNALIVLKKFSLG